MNNDPRYNTGDSLRDAFRFLADASFAVLPRDTAYKLGEFEKNFWGGVRWFAERSIACVDDTLHGADTLRAQWQMKRDEEEARRRAAREAGPSAGPTESPAGGI